MRVSLLLAVAVLVVYLSYSDGLGWRPRRYRFRPIFRPRFRPIFRPRFRPRFRRYIWPIRIAGRDVTDSLDSDQNEIRDAIDERETTLNNVIEALQTLVEQPLSDQEQEKQ
ncbi:uncharacterized protein [Haliotis asinina]|uniref:uncharacterized protein n=1 Tax=Haliotis asinina TaxID=109174 RepID=UPI003531CECF